MTPTEGNPPHHRRLRDGAASDDQIGFNSRLAALMTKGVGSMWVVYFTTALVLAWIFLAELGPLGFDRYPFPFLLFLGNVVQLLLVFVILVGQQVLSAASDKRAVQTYQDAERILTEVHQLHDHLADQDRVLNQGIALFQATPHPWVAARAAQGPVAVEDQHIGRNGRIGAAITRTVGTMWAFYIATVFQFGWMTLSAVGVIRFDPYPFAFLLFLSSLSQLILMFVIMVGQQVLGLAGERRAQMTYLDAEAVLHDCSQLQEHLQAQDEVIVAIVGHVEAAVGEKPTPGSDAPTPPPAASG